MGTNRGALALNPPPLALNPPFKCCPLQVVDETCTLEQTWVQMEALVDAGLVKYIGLANFDLPQVTQLN
jgi:diketogulonate reductase-like aldo/keto reductase